MFPLTCFRPSLSSLFFSFSFFFSRHLTRNWQASYWNDAGSHSRKQHGKPWRNFCRKHFACRQFFAAGTKRLRTAQNTNPDVLNHSRQPLWNRHRE
ncbi:hypothetical protein K505DRAFT_2349 [Melanomma pulvis-pyrius CBS 109.77]|uniref:Uncharacterized protein n=1 Tax=Melanomma pulvis-pyrius CBS 109.77 TaxID=1314802 RepID=A0A6A6XJF9_9PLEO|nr:hypothetical protein K505DRAFT_2349 [Melanomma pulvis-pyrius CBS 109.77]